MWIGLDWIGLPPLSPSCVVFVYLFLFVLFLLFYFFGPGFVDLCAPFFSVAWFFFGGGGGLGLEVFRTPLSAPISFLGGGKYPPRGRRTEILLSRLCWFLRFSLGCESPFGERWVGMDGWMGMSEWGVSGA